MRVQLCKIDALPFEVFMHLIIRHAIVADLGALTNRKAMDVSGQDLEERGAPAAWPAKSKKHIPRLCQPVEVAKDLDASGTAPGDPSSD
ncbi:hypothetical protein PG996_010911 [Apiospora saccharicola]|uniref:Uncharacterized protein n=1 Tax=Apiospora saccharicola TaxID=335842 RepID=A0ABR1USD7_9PEZI